MHGSVNEFTLEQSAASPATAEKQIAVVAEFDALERALVGGGVSNVSFA